jgi:hypothetical protein
MVPICMDVLVSILVLVNLNPINKTLLAKIQIEHQLQLFQFSNNQELENVAGAPQFLYGVTKLTHTYSKA